MMQIPPPSPDHLHLDPQQQQQQSLLEGHSSSLPVRLQVLRPHQHHQQQDKEQLQVSKRMSRRKSPSQKIPRNRSARSIPSHPNQYEADENGNPQITSGPLTCFSYRTMEKQYEKDTQRMLERIQKSRSFEQQKQQRQQEGTSRTNNDGTAKRSVSLKDLSSTANNPSRNLYYDTGFYIGDDESFDHTSNNTFEHDYIDHGHYYHLDHHHHQQQQQEQQSFENGAQFFEQEEEIFELDL